MDWRDKKTSIKEKLEYILTHGNCKQDVIIVLGSQEAKLSAHSFVLSIASQHFEQLIINEATINEDGMTEIKLPDVTLPAMNVALKYMYTDQVDFELCNAIQDILNAALKLNLHDLALHCVAKLKEEITSNSAYSVRESQSAPDSKTCYSLEFVLRNASYAIQQNLFLTLTQEHLRTLLASDDLDVDEIDLFKAVLSWAKAECRRSGLEENVENLRLVLKKLIPLMRYTLMTIDDFATVVAPTNILYPEEMNDVFQYLTLKNINLKNGTEFKLQQPKWMFSSTTRKTQNGNPSAATLEISEINRFESGQAIEENTKKEILLKYLKSVSGSKIISGLCYSSKAAVEGIETMTTMNPGMICVKMPSFADGETQWQTFVDEAIAFWKSGSLIYIVWENAQHPLYSVKVFQSQAPGLTVESMWNDLLKDGSHLNKAWTKQLDSIAPFLRQLQKAGIVPIFDILPHLNLKFSWWRGLGGMNGSWKLFRMTHDYLVKHHRLNSFIWTWSLHNSGDMVKLEEYWPGNEYVDVASVHMDNTTDISMAAYQMLQSIIGDKPISLENNYYVPTPQVLAQYPQCTWFNARDDFLTHASYNNATNLKLTFHNLSVINRGAVDFFNKMPSNIK